MNRFLLFIPLTLMFFLSLPENVVGGIRSRFTSAVAPLTCSKKALVAQEEKNLQLENYQLRRQLDLVYEWIVSEQRLNSQVEMYKSLEKIKEGKAFFERRAKQMKTFLQSQAMSSLGRVIYRDPSLWSSSFWIDIGELENQALGQVVIAKNSPVLSGNCLVGLIDYVGKHQSRVRLITDFGLKTAVRAVRGSIVERELAFQVQNLIHLVTKQPELKKGKMEDLLLKIKEELRLSWEDGFFAKGELSGSSAPYFRSLGSVLKGVGFNCDFGDEEGPQRDLNSRIVQEGDFLVTSGLDGVFPPGLHVGIVTKINPLKPGDFSYELEAKPAFGVIADLASVFVLPPIGAD